MYLCTNAQMCAYTYAHEYKTKKKSYFVKNGRYVWKI